MSYPVLAFEREEDLRGEWIPMAVRMKLDLVGLKIGLKDWQALALEPREELIDIDVEDEAGIAHFERRLREILEAADRDMPCPLSEKKLSGRSLWKEAGPVPPEVARLAGELGVDLRWSELDRFGRFVLWHLSLKGSGGRFGQALEVFVR